MGNAVVRWPDSYAAHTFTDFSCACAVPNEPLGWGYSPECAGGGARAAANGLAPCRRLVPCNPSDQSLYPGYSPGTSEQGLQCDSAFCYSVLAGPNNVELLCRGG